MRLSRSIACLLIPLSLALGPMAAAIELSGRYTGDSGGDPVVLELQQQGEQLSGVLVDSQQRYQFEARIDGDEIVGTATEQSLGIVFEVHGGASAEALDLNLSIEVQGQRADQALRLQRVRAQAAAPSAPAAAPAAGSRDPALVGQWVHESNYQSGSGDSYFAASSREGMIFYADGRLANSGGEVSVSGGDYFGQSSGGGGDALPGVSWETRDQHVFLVGEEQGQPQRVDLGRYYVENGHLLITGNNGKKMLFSRVR